MNEYFLTDLKRDVSEKTNYTQESIETILRTAFDIITDKVAIEGRKVYLINFFNFEPKDYKEKQTVHPQTGEPMLINAYRTILTKPTKAVKRKLKMPFEK